MLVLKIWALIGCRWGCRLLDNRLLKKIGRKHTAEDVYQTIRLLDKHDFQNITIDLIYALPGQTMESFRDTLTRAIDLGLPHYAMYSLILENKTMFMNWVRQGKMELPSQESETQMFEEAITAMAKAGLSQYEISNFSRQDMSLSTILFIGIMNIITDLAQERVVISDRRDTKLWTDPALSASIEGRSTADP